MRITTHFNNRDSVLTGGIYCIRIPIVILRTFRLVKRMLKSLVNATNRQVVRYSTKGTLGCEVLSKRAIG